jgi:hypothetical protein
MSLAGIGALIASVSLLAIPHSRRMLVMRLGAALSVVAMLLLAAAPGFPLAAVGITLLTLGLNFLYGISNQVVQERAPDPLRGRISAVAALSFVAVLPFSGLMASGLDRLVGMRMSLVICATGYAIVATSILARRLPAAEAKSGPA